MIDKDGIERPDSPDQNMLEIKNETRKVQFDDKYPYRPRNIFFRVWAAIFRAMAIMVFNPVMTLKYKLYTFGNKHKKSLKHKPFIITCNHVHMYDDLSIGTNVFGYRKIYYTTLSRNIRRPAIGFFLRSLGGIPVPVESLSGMKKFNEDISEILNSNKPVLYNPEASLWPYYREIRPYKRGAFSMAVKNNVPVLPMIVLFKRKQRKNGKFKYKIYFAMCNPVYADKTITDERAQIDDMMNRVYEKSKQVAEDWYNIQDCGFGDEKVKRILNPRRDLIFENDKWLVKNKQ